MCSSWGRRARRTRCWPASENPPAGDGPGQSLDTTRIHRVAGLTGDRTALATAHPCRAPHHTISDVGLIGGGQVPLPGEVSRAHHGVLLLDARPEFRRHVLDVLHQPVENGILYIQSPARPGYQCFRSLSRTAHDLRGLGQRTTAAHHKHCAPNVRGASILLLRFSV
jgi:Magnesium chelatase, subunit ChlI